MNKILLILTIFSFTSTQVLALSCGASCSLQETSTKSKSTKHDCCPSKSKEKEKKKTSDCMGEVNGVCFHEFGSSSATFKDTLELSIKIVFSQEFPLFSITKLAILNYRYRRKIPDAHLLQHKSQLKIYLSHEQFLI